MKIRTMITLGLLMMALFFVYMDMSEGAIQFYDDFDRADAAALGNGWTESGNNDLEILNDRMYSDGSARGDGANDNGTSLSFVCWQYNNTSSHGGMLWGYQRSDTRTTWLYWETATQLQYFDGAVYQDCGAAAAIGEDEWFCIQQASPYNVTRGSASDNMSFMCEADTTYDRALNDYVIALDTGANHPELALNVICGADTVAECIAAGGAGAGEMSVGYIGRPPNGDHVHDTEPVNWSSFPYGGNLDYYDVIVLNGTTIVQTITNETSNLSTNWTTTGLSDDNYTIMVNGYHTNGSVLNVSNSVTVDNTDPVLTAIFPTTDLETVLVNYSYNVSFQCTDYNLNQTVLLYSWNTSEDEMRLNTSTYNDLLNGTFIHAYPFFANVTGNNSQFPNGIAQFTCRDVAGNMVQTEIRFNVSMGNTSMAVLDGIMQPNVCPDNSVQEVMIFGLLFIMVITFFVLNMLWIKIPIVSILCGMALIAFSWTLLGCNYLVAGACVGVSIFMMLFEFLDIPTL